MPSVKFITIVLVASIFTIAGCVRERQMPSFSELARNSDLLPYSGKLIRITGLAISGAKSGPYVRCGAVAITCDLRQWPPDTNGKVVTVVGVLRQENVRLEDQWAAHAGRAGDILLFLDNTTIENPKQNDSVQYRERPGTGSSSDKVVPPGVE